MRSTGPPFLAVLFTCLFGCDPSTPSSALDVVEAREADVCEAACEPDIRCCTERFVHGGGASVGWTRRGEPMFAVDDSADAAAVLAHMKQWIAERPTRAGLVAAMPDTTPLAGLVARPGPARRHRALVLHRFDQSYRGLPVVGAGEQVSMTLKPGYGAVSVSGAIADARDAYAGWGATSSAAAALTAAQKLLATDEQEIETVPFSFGEPRLVAVVEVRALAWEIEVTRSGHPRGTLLLRADSGAMLAFSPAAHFGPDDETPVTLRARSFASDVYDLKDPGTQFVADIDQAAVTGGPLLGSIYTPRACDDDPDALPECGQIRLGNRQVIVLDAQKQDFYGDSTSHLRVAASPDGEFLATPPATAADPSPLRDDAALQDYFYRLQATYSLIDGYHASNWDPFREEDSGFPALAFKPRVVLAHNTDVELTCGQPQPGCANHYWPRKFDDFTEQWVYDEHPEADLPAHVWPGDSKSEAMGYIGTAVDGFTSPSLVFHEFGHVVDLFTAPFTLGTGVVGSGCDLVDKNKPCVLACVPDSTDEAEPLAETVADMVALFSVGRLYTSVTHDRCGAITGIASGAGPVHDPACIDHPGDIKSFLDQRPTEPDAFESDGLWIPTGVCATSPGYRQTAILQAWWEWTHGRSCAVVEPFSCEVIADEASGARSGIEALLFALSQTNATYYRKLLSDMETYIACTDGPAMASHFREVFCHHGAMDCGGLPAACPMVCGDGVAELTEACDGADLRGQSCFDRGFSGGDLACKPDCTYDVSACTEGSGSTNATETTAPTSGPDIPTIGHDSGASPSAGTTDGQDSAGSDHAEDGCGCRQGPGPLGLLALALMLPRRRRVDGASRGGVA